jgi:capsular polysaccharide biosynthesis protein
VPASSRFSANCLAIYLQALLANNVGQMTTAMRRKLRSIPTLAWARLARFNILARTSAHQDFSTFLHPGSQRWQATLAAARRGQRVLLATNLGGHFALAAIDRLLAVALTLRGAHATTVLCDAILPACQMCEINLVPDAAVLARRGPPRLLCKYCYSPAADQLRALRLPAAELGHNLSDDERARAYIYAGRIAAADIRTASWNGLPVGEHAYAGALRYFARGTIDQEPLGEAVLRRFLASAIVTAAAYGRLFESLRPEVVVAHHGIYTPQGIVTALARSRGIRIVTWNPAYRRHCFIFSHDDTYHHTLMDEPTGRWALRPLAQQERESTLSYLRSRWTGTGDWIRFHKNPDDLRAVDLKGLGLDLGKPYCVAFTNVFWDAQLHYPANAFSGQLEWLVETIRWFASRPDLQLVIRVHPAEISGSPPSRQLAVDEIASAFPNLPKNVFIISPDSTASSYMLAEYANAVLIYATKMGVELAAVGIPIIVAGEAWVRNKGFTLDATSKQHYFELLSRLPFAERLDSGLRERALAYAHHFFFRRMIPLPFVEPESGPRRFTVAVSDLDALSRGADAGLDAICDGILSGSPFEMPPSPSG